jgi:hypothetical protein
MDASATRPDARLFAGAFAAAAVAALAAGLLLPHPPPPVAPRFGEPGRAAPTPAARALERALAGRTDDPVELRQLADELRAAHRPLELAALLERLHLATGEAAPLREAMELRIQLGDFAAARRALTRLSAIGATTEAEEVAIAETRQEAGDEAGAIAGLVNALGRLPGPELAARAVAALARLPDPAPPIRMLSARLADTAPELLEPLRRMLMAEARPDLAVALIEGLPPADLATPAAVFRLAEAEARAGFAGSALSRLLALRSTEGLPPGGGALLVDLALREGRLEEAFSVAGQLPAEAWPPGLVLRLQGAARLAGRAELFRAIEPARLAPRPEVAAPVALARGDRAAAGRFARAALERPPGTAEGARGLAAVLRELGQDGAAWERLRGEMSRAEPMPNAIRLFAELSALPGRGGTALPLLERLRATSPAAGEAWLRLTLQEGRRTEAASFLRAGGLVGAAALVETLSGAATARDAVLAEAAAAALRMRVDLPEGWTPEEVAVTAALSRPLTSGALTAALDFLAVSAEAEARRRVTSLVAAAPEVAAVAGGLDTTRHPAIAALRREAETGEGDVAVARIALLAVLSPRDALPLLSRRAVVEPGRFGGALALARLRADGAEAGEAELRRLLPRLPRAQQEGVLHLALAAAPAEAQPMLRRMAEEMLGPDWRRGYEAALTRNGRRAELAAALRSRAAVPDMPDGERRAIAERLRDLGDREGAEAVLR